MSTSTSAGYRAAAIGVASAALLVGAFSLGATRGQGATAQAATPSPANSPARITVTGTGTVTGTPDQLILSMGVQVNGSTVSSALSQANMAVRRVTAVLRARGVAGADIQTAGLSVEPNYQGSSQVPVSYGVSETLTVTLDQLGQAGRQIQGAVHAGGNAVTVDNVALNLTDTGPLLAAARASAVRDARAKATQFAAAMGESLGPVISVTAADESGLAPEPLGLSAVNGKAAASVPISPGSQQVNVSITVVYAA
jgi:uncharacterized protein YggE